MIPAPIQTPYLTATLLGKADCQQHLSVPEKDALAALRPFVCILPLQPQPPRPPIQNPQDLVLACGRKRVPPVVPLNVLDQLLVHMALPSLLPSLHVPQFDHSVRADAGQHVGRGGMEAQQSNLSFVGTQVDPGLGDTFFQPSFMYAPGLHGSVLST